MLLDQLTVIWLLGLIVTFFVVASFWNRLAGKRPEDPTTEMDGIIICFIAVFWWFSVPFWCTIQISNLHKKRQNRCASP